MAQNVSFEPNSHVVAYLRDSGGTTQDLSITQQQDAIAKWAAENNIFISLYYIDEARSGTTLAGRKAFQQMMDHFRQPLVKESGLVLWSFSRFARDINSAMRFKSEIRSRGFKVVSITDPIPDDEDGVLIEFLNDWSNDKFSKRNSREAKRGLHFNFDTYGAIGGVPPRGFKREQMLIGRHRDGSKRYVSKWVPDLEIWETCKLAWQLRADGMTYRQINDITHLFGSMNSYVTFFKNRLYKGELVYGDKVIPDYVEPMIDEETWLRVQSQVSKKNDPRISEYHPRRTGANFLLTGLLYCSRCGAPMNGNVVKFADEDKPYEYYICSRAGQRHECNALRIPKVPLEAAVYQKMKEFILNPSLVYERQRALLADRAEESFQLNQLKIELKKNITATKAKIKNLTDVLEQGGISSISVVTRIKELEIDLHKYTDQLMEIVNQEVFGIGNISPEEAENNAKIALSQIQNQDPEKLRKVFAAMIHTIEAEKDNKLIRGSITFINPPSDLSQNNSDGPDKPSPTPNRSPENGQLLEFMSIGGLPVGAQSQGCPSRSQK
jgi:site-specific DNA recombinase